MYIKVKVAPNSRKEIVEKESDTIYRIQVREPAARNLANKRVSEILAELFKESVSGPISLVSGHRSPSKVFDIPLSKKQS